MTKVYVLHRTEWVPKPLRTVFEFFAQPSNLQILTPPWLNFRITETPSELCAGSIIHYELRLHRIPIHWTTEITDWRPPYSFVDTQTSGPYTLWQHQHTFSAKRDGTLIDDTVHHSLPFGPLGRIAHWAFVGQDLEKIFDYRQQKMTEILAS